MSKSFELMALDADFQIVELLRCTLIQWTRRFYESGFFSIQIPVNQYDPSMKYIYTRDRNELGEISQINYTEDGNGVRYYSLSGYFLERELNRRVCYAKGTTNITNQPSWINQSDVAENVALAFYNGFKDVKYTYGGTSFESLLGIETATSQGRGHQSEHERCNEYLGDKMYSILKPSQMSYRVNFDFQTYKKKLEIIKGLDRTQDNADGNNPIIFSTRYGNLIKPNILISSSDYKNCYISSNSYSENDVNVVNVQANCLRTNTDTADRFLYVSASANHSDYSTSAEYLEAIHTEGREKLKEYPIKMSFDFDTLEGSYEYLVDFDLGDKVSIEVPEISISEDAVLIECAEVIKNGAWSMSMEFEV